MFNDYNDMVTVYKLCEMILIGKNKAYELFRMGKVGGFHDVRLWMIPKESVISYTMNNSKI